MFDGMTTSMCKENLCSLTTYWNYEVIGLSLENLKNKWLLMAERQTSKHPVTGLKNF